MSHRDELLAVLNARTIQTNEVGRSALLGPALSWVAADEPIELIDVGCSAGMNLLCDRFLLDYGPHGITGPTDSPVHVDCVVSGGHPPIAPALPPIAGRIGIDLDPPDLEDPDDTRWLVSCIWPGTGRFERAERAMEIGRADPPTIVPGDAFDVLPGVLDSRADGHLVVLNSWSFSYFPVERRQEYVEILSMVARQRPLTWLVMDVPGLVESAFHPMPPTGSPEPDAIVSVTFGPDGRPTAEALALVQSHGRSMTWLAPA